MRIDTEYCVFLDSIVTGNTTTPSTRRSLRGSAHVWADEEEYDGLAIFGDPGLTSEPATVSADDFRRELQTVTYDVNAFVSTDVPILRTNTGSGDDAAAAYAALVSRANASVLSGNTTRELQSTASQLGATAVANARASGYSAGALSLVSNPTRAPTRAPTAAPGDKDEAADVLSDEEIVLIVVFTVFGVALLALAASYFISKRHEEKQKSHIPDGGKVLVMTQSDYQLEQPAFPTDEEQAKTPVKPVRNAVEGRAVIPGALSSDSTDVRVFELERELDVEGTPASAGRSPLVSYQAVYPEDEDVTDMVAMSQTGQHKSFGEGDEGGGDLAPGEKTLLYSGSARRADGDDFDDLHVIRGAESYESVDDEDGPDEEVAPVLSRFDSARFRAISSIVAARAAAAISTSGSFILPESSSSPSRPDREAGQSSPARKGPVHGEDQFDTTPIMDIDGAYADPVSASPRMRHSRATSGKGVDHATDDAGANSETSADPDVDSEAVFDIKSVENDAGDSHPVVGAGK